MCVDNRRCNLYILSFNEIRYNLFNNVNCTFKNNMAFADSNSSYSCTGGAINGNIDSYNSYMYDFEIHSCIFENNICIGSSKNAT